MNSCSEYRIIVRGAGDIATGSIHRLVKAGFRPLVLEVERPSAIRRTVSFCEAVYEGSAEIEGVTARHVADLEEAADISEKGEVPVLVDSEGACIKEYRPDAVIDAILAKKNLGTSREMAPLTIALGPGFEAGIDCDYVIETMRGHNLGRIIDKGSAMPNTGVPGLVGGVSSERVIHAPVAGAVKHVREIGDAVDKGETVAYMMGADDSKTPVPASITGLLRGLIREGYIAAKGLKIADIDPRPDERDNCFTISDKARAIGGSVLEIITHDFISKQSEIMYNIGK